MTNLRVLRHHHPVRGARSGQRQFARALLPASRIRHLSELAGAVLSKSRDSSNLYNYADSKVSGGQAASGRPSLSRLHFTPTRASWVNPVESCFARIRRHGIRRGGFETVSRDSNRAITRFLDHQNQNAKPHLDQDTIQIKRSIRDAKQDLHTSARLWATVALVSSHNRRLENER